MRRIDRECHRGTRPGAFHRRHGASLHGHGEALKPGAPLAFTYHHNNLEAYHSIGVAILDAGLTCSASLPCPAEMGGSIHIFGTGSSIIDTVFVCRLNGKANRVNCSIQLMS